MSWGNCPSKVTKLNISLRLGSGGLIVLGFLLFYFGAPRAYAAETNATPYCQFGAELENLSSIQNDSNLDYLQKIKAELAIRKKILGEVIDCATQEAEALKVKLGEANVKDAEVAATKLKLSDEIDQAITFYKNKAKTIPDLGIYGSKNLAGQLSEWRAFNYSNLVLRVANLISWNNSQGIINLVKKRLDNIKMAFIDLEVADPNLEKIMQTAEDNLKKAEDTNELVRRAIVNSYQVDQQLMMIKDSLEATAEVYKNFFEISDILTASSTTNK